MAPPVFVTGDARRLCQALDNLVSNAIRHGGSQIVLRATLNGGDLRLVLRDGGPGPSPAALGARVVPIGHEHGHGLAIAKLAVESCGGTITALDGGVLVELPVQGPVPLDRAASAVAPSPA